MKGLSTRIRVSAIALLEVAVMVSGIAAVMAGAQSTTVSAAHCNQVYGGVVYSSHGFYNGRCANVKNFPNTGTPYVSATDGNADSVGYVIPRTSKDFSTGSEALANVSDKMSFYNRLKYHYEVRGWQQENWWAKDGAAFIVFSLIGKTPPADRNLSDADWAEFWRRLDNPNLTMALDSNYPLSPNSAAIHDSTGRLDFFHFVDSLGKRGPSFVFKLNGVTVGSIERKCANLQGRFQLPRAPAQWRIIGDSKVGVNNQSPDNSVLTASPGQTLYWRHALGNVGPNNTSQPIGYAIGKSGFSAGSWSNNAPPDNKEPQGTTNINANAWFGVGWGTPRPNYSQYTVRQVDVGNTLCQSISWGPTAFDNPAWSESTPRACVYIPYNYNLIPSVTGSSGMGAVGSTIPPVTATVNNLLPGNGNATTRSPDTSRWEVYRVEVPPGRTIPMTQQQNGSAPCAHYRSVGATTCASKGSGNRSFPPGVPTMVAQIRNETIGAGTPAGTKVCFTLSLQPYSQTTNNWRHSAPVCMTVSKQPKVQAWGSDVRSRGRMETGTTVITTGGSDKLFGSWVEYGGFSSLANSGFASGSGLNNGNSNTAPDAWNKLTFANVDSSGNDNYGGFTLPPLPNLSAQFMGPATGVMRADIGSLNSGTYKVNNYTITGGAIDKGKTIIIIATGKITISGNITYKDNGNYTAISELPQVIIIAGSIDIANAATQIDAWLLTTGTAGAINTCSDRAITARLNSTVCNNQLTVNGPVVTGHLYLRRTAGSDTAADAGKPAEIFNLRPDAYLWAQKRASQSGKVQTVYSVELPPRF
ncbi:MAG TPA: hypothetical protein VGO98_00720 [Candidatus Saccharimonadales bacterium]|jgi:hypothetical protein|nr:hypothetical protein [Candidatus Saccharimonadales bacterium]